MVEILCTLIGVVSGIAIVAGLMQNQSAKNPVESNEEALLPDETESLKGITSQLQMLTHRVAADVSAHTQKVVHINERLLPAQNEPERILTAITDLIQANESMQGQLEAAQDRLSKQSVQLESTARQARTDALTGLANRRALEETLKKCIDSIGQQQVTGLMLIDIDHFKSFNDTYGHITGDAVLASFARSLTKWCNGNHYSARYGGEEFAIILNGDSSGTLARLAADVRAYISEQVITHEDLRLTITASAGLTILQEGDTTNRVYERADEGLYRSKKAGRNRGYWMDLCEWKPFPSANASNAELQGLVSADPANFMPQNSVAQQATFQQATFQKATVQKATVQKQATVQKPIAQQTSQGLPTTPLPLAQPVSAQPTDEPATPHSAESAQIKIDNSGVLELVAFVERLDGQLKQLARARMPATAIMLEAVGLAPGMVQDFDRSWSEVLEIVKSNLRGIDLICRLRHNAVCVFMPGCTLNASLERASGMQLLLEERQASCDDEHYPERFAIAASCCQPNETAGVFLQRLEEALDEAQDAAPLELVVCDAGSTYFQASQSASRD